MNAFFICSIIYSITFFIKWLIYASHFSELWENNDEDMNPTFKDSAFHWFSPETLWNTIYYIAQLDY